MACSMPSIAFCVWVSRIRRKRPANHEALDPETSLRGLSSARLAEFMFQDSGDSTVKIPTGGG